jgi:hypothetical protein
MRNWSDSIRFVRLTLWAHSAVRLILWPDPDRARCRDRPFCAAKAAEGASLRTVEWSQRPPRFEMPASRKSEIDGGT